MSPHTAVSSRAADLIAADAARYLDNVALEKPRHLSMYTQTCLPPARLAISTRLDQPPTGCEDPAWESLAAHEGFTAGADASPARQPTEVRVAHDDANLYVHFVCPEPHPERRAHLEAAAWFTRLRVPGSEAETGTPGEPTQ